MGVPLARIAAIPPHVEILPFVRERCELRRHALDRRGDFGVAQPAQDGAADGTRNGVQAEECWWASLLRCASNLFAAVVAVGVAGAVVTGAVFMAEAGEGSAAKASLLVEPVEPHQMHGLGAPWAPLGAEVHPGRR